MSNFNDIRFMGIDEFAKWLDRYGSIDDAPWLDWWDKNYCNKCVAESINGHEYAWCELNCKCKYFQDMKDIPNSEQVIKMWLELESEN